MIAGQLPEQLVAHFELRVPVADGFHPPGYIRPEYTPARTAQPTEAGIKRPANQPFPVGAVQRDGEHPDERFVGGRERLFHFLDGEHIRRPIAALDDGFHTLPVGSGRFTGWSRRAIVCFARR